MEGDINGFIQSKSTGREPPGKALTEGSLVSAARSGCLYTRPRLGWFTFPYWMEVDQTQAGGQCSSILPGESIQFPGTSQPLVTPEDLTPLTSTGTHTQIRKERKEEMKEHILEETLKIKGHLIRSMET